MAARCVQGLKSNLGCCLGERGKDAAGVEPARAQRSEYLVPVEVAGFKLRDCGMAAIRATKSGAHTIAAFSEVQTVAHRTADTVIFHPAHQRLVDTTLVNE